MERRPGGPSATVVFRVDPDRRVFDAVRRAVVSSLSRDHADVFDPDGVREHCRVDAVVIEPPQWRVQGDLADGGGLNYDVTIPGAHDATADVRRYLRAAASDKFGDRVDAEALRFRKVDLKTQAWFVDARLPPTGGDV